MEFNFASLQTRGVKLVLIDIFITGKIQGKPFFTGCVTASKIIQGMISWLIEFRDVLTPVPAIAGGVECVLYVRIQPG
ncbi:MAG: hypothetical protein ABS69_10135 [Nitrosomonadales bacterium SCN 54-20]|nr:MAG: hypothetical protein ABS69_10135 [Nitrosomonadales bacterium SCN 54-20]